MLDRFMRKQLKTKGEDEEQDSPTTETKNYATNEVLLNEMDNDNDNYMKLVGRKQGSNGKANTDFSPDGIDARSLRVKDKAGAKPF